MSTANQRLLNVDNGPGANGLRGGIKQYSAKTTTGQWLDTYGGPMGYKRGFTTSDFQTEAQHAQLGVVRRPTGPFGAGIPIVESRDARGNDLGAVGTETWISNTKATHPDFGVIRKEDTTYKLLNPRLSREKLLQYRQQWTCDKESNRKIRFQTESRIAGNAAAGKFLTNNLRVLPGTPKSMETYRTRLVERFGIFAMSALKLHIGLDSMSCKEFRARIQEVGVDIKPYELSQIIAYITPSSTDLTVKEVEGFLLLMKGHTEGFSSQAVSQVFFSLCNDASEGVTLPVNTLLCSIDTENHPEIAEGFARFLPAYGGDELSVEQFIDIHDDMHSSSPDNFSELLKTVWRL